MFANEGSGQSLTCERRSFVRIHETFANSVLLFSNREGQELKTYHTHLTDINWTTDHGMKFNQIALQYEHLVYELWSRLYIVLTYRRKSPIISSGLIFVEKAVLLGLFSGENIFGGAYYWREFCVLK